MQCFSPQSHTSPKQGNNKERTQKTYVATATSVSQANTNTSVFFTSPCELAILADTGRCLVLFRATEAPYAETAVSAFACRSVTVGPVLLRSSVGFISSSGMGFVLTKQKEIDTLGERIFEHTSTEKLLR